MYDKLIKRLREVADEVDNDYDVDPYNAEQRSLVIEQAADAVEKLTAENKRLKNKIRDMKSSASWDDDIRRGQVQGMW